MSVVRQLCVSLSLFLMAGFVDDDDEWFQNVRVCTLGRCHGPFTPLLTKDSRCCYHKNMCKSRWGVCAEAKRYFLDAYDALPWCVTGPVCNNNPHARAFSSHQRIIQTLTGGNDENKGWIYASVGTFTRCGFVTLIVSPKGWLQPYSPWLEAHICSLGDRKGIIIVIKIGRSVSGTFALVRLPPWQSSILPRRSTQLRSSGLQLILQCMATVKGPARNKLYRCHHHAVRERQALKSMAAPFFAQTQML